MTRTQLTQKIKQLYRKKQPLNINRVRESHPHLLEAAYAFKPFLGWRQALEKAGLSYSKIISEVETHLECPYCGLHFKGLSAHLRIVHEVSTEDLRLDFPGLSITAEATRAIHNPDHATMPHWEYVWSKEYVLDRCWQWYLASEKCNQDFINRCDPCLSAAATPHHYASWDDVIRALCLDPRKIREHRPLDDIFPDKDALLDAIRKHHAEGKPLSAGPIQRDYCQLCNGANKYFQGWPAAVKAAGLEKVHKKEGHLNRLTLPPMRYPEKRDVLKAMQQRHAEGLSLSCSIVMKEDAELTRCFRYHFKHWKDGIKEARLVRVHKKDVRKSFENRGAYPTDESVLEAILKLHKEGYSMSSSAVYNSHSALISQAYAKFGSWGKARELAGIDINDLPRSIRLRNQAPLSKTSTIGKLRERNEKELSLLSSKVGENDPNLCHHVRKYFDSWADAIKAAGLTKIHRQQVDRVRKDAGERLRITTYPTKKSALDALRQRVKDGKSILGKVIGEDDPDLLYIMKRDFGNVIKPINQAGLKKQYDKEHKAVQRKRVKYLTPESALEALRKRASEGHCILSNSVHKADASLYQKSLLWFGTWIDTCREAGVEKIYQQTIRKRAELRDTPLNQIT